MLEVYEIIKKNYIFENDCTSDINLVNNNNVLTRKKKLNINNYN